MRIAFMGTRGVPAAYSGFETFVEEVGARLAARGHAVTVYNRSHHVRYEGTHYRGMRLVSLPSIPTKHLDTIVHTLLSMLHGFSDRPEIVYVCIVGNAPLVWIPRLWGGRVVFNVDGADWAREKWGGGARGYLRFCERLAPHVADRIIADARTVQAYYRERYGADADFVPYGSNPEPPADPGAVAPLLEPFGLAPGRYFLYVGRLVPENHPEHLVEAFLRFKRKGGARGFRAVIVGDAPYAGRYIEALHRAAEGDPDVLFPGYQFGEAYRALSRGAYVYVETKGAGGTHPALLQAMGFGSAVVVNDMPSNLEVIGEAGRSYPGGAGGAGLAAVLEELVEAPAEVARLGRLASTRVREHYSWDAVAERYEGIFARLLGRNP